MKDSKKMFSNPRQLIMDLFAGNVWTTIEIFMVEKYQRFLGWNKDSQWREKTLKNVVEAYDSQLLNKL